MASLNRIKIIFNRMTGFGRVLPDFLMIGVPRGGTTSLYNYLLESPNIFSPLWKEISYFSDHYDKGSTWYRHHFPTTLQKYYFQKAKRVKFLTGEASSIYLYHPLAPKRIKYTVPNVKMIALLRNPVDRAHSHYWQSIRKKRETHSFEEEITKQMKIEPKDYYESFSFKDASTKNDFLNQYLAGGIYVEGIKRYFQVFSKNQILILKSEDLYDNLQIIVKNIAKFLEIPNWKINNNIKYNYNKEQPQMDNSMRKLLADYFKPHNEKLYKYLGTDLGWD